MDQATFLKKMAEYFEKELNPTQVEVWMGKLGLLPRVPWDEMLDAVVSTFTFFPRMNEFIKLHAEVHRERVASTDERRDWLAVERAALMAKYIENGELNEDEWMALAERFRQAKRQHGAKHIEKRYKLYKAEKEGAK